MALVRLVLSPNRHLPKVREYLSREYPYLIGPYLSVNFTARLSAPELAAPASLAAGRPLTRRPKPKKLSKNMFEKTKSPFAITFAKSNTVRPRKPKKVKRVEKKVLRHRGLTFGIVSQGVKRTSLCYNRSISPLTLY